MSKKNIQMVDLIGQYAKIKDLVNKPINSINHNIMC